MVAWHGNYAPYKYDLSKFMAINCVAFDHAVSIEYVDASKLQLLCIKPFSTCCCCDVSDTRMCQRMTV